MRFGENNVLGSKYIDIYQLRWFVGELHPPYIFLKKVQKVKTEKVQEHDL